ncbi:hypothetical protein ABH922_000852 [Rhodococcus sp. 27YEA15]|uniref:hypothetical protein n=1 Tax=Rhodococcus sp. 27YEA15 TaxID=3156259 RepID=UPI003C7B7CCD
MARRLQLTGKVWADGRREFSIVKSLTVQNFNAPLNLPTIERKAREMKIARWMLGKRHAKP